MKISKKVFDYLLDHMLDIHKRKISIASPYSRDYDAYTAILEFLNTYIRKIGDFLDTAVVDDVNCAIPFVTMGSTVYTEGPGLADRMVYSIVLPEEVAEVQDAKRIKVYACLTPVSNALLLRRIDEKVMFEENGQMRHCTIKRIDYS